MNVLKSKIGPCVERMLSVSTCLVLISACVCQGTLEIQDKAVAELVRPPF